MIMLTCIIDGKEWDCVMDINRKGVWLCPLVVVRIIIDAK